MKFRRFSAAVLAAVMMTAAVPSAASAEEAATRHIVVLGDGIAAGTGLAEDEQSCAEQIAVYMNAEITCFAEDTYTTGDVLTCLEQAEVQAALADADVILVSAGINDVMGPYTELAYEYLEEFGLTSFSQLFESYHAQMGLTEAEMLKRSTYLSARTTVNKASCISNIRAIGEKLSQYQDAKVIYLNVYNPMDNIENFSSLTENRQLAYSMAALYPIAGVLNDPDNINPTYNKIAEKYNATVVDTYSLFAGKAYKYSRPAELEHNLNAEAQALLSVETAKASGILRYGDLDGDMDVSAADSSLVLEHAAAVGSGNPGTLNAVQATAADVNTDREIDSADSASILVYAAMKGAGLLPAFDSVLTK